LRARHGADEANEKGVVPLTDAVVDEGAVMIEPEHAMVAVLAVRGTGRPDDLARSAPLVALSNEDNVLMS